MMKLVAAAAVVAMGMTGIATADQANGPTVMTEAQMDQIVAGANGWWNISNNGTDFSKHLVPAGFNAVGGSNATKNVLNFVNGGGFTICISISDTNTVCSD